MSKVQYPMHQGDIPWKKTAKKDEYVLTNGNYPKRQYTILFKKPFSCKNIIYVLDTCSIPVEKVQSSLFVVVLKDLLPLKKLFHWFNMKEVCTLLNQLFEHVWTILQRVFPKIMTTCSHQ